MEKEKGVKIRMSTKIVIPFILIFLGTIGVVFYFSTTLIRIHLEKALNEKMVLLTKSLSSGLENPFLYQMYDQVQSVVASSTKMSKDVVYAYALNPDGKCYGSTDPSLIGKVILRNDFERDVLKIDKLTKRRVPKNKGIFEYVNPILSQGIKVGILRVGFSTQSTEDVINGVMFILFLSGGIGIAIGLIIFLLIVRTQIVKPVRKVVEGLKKLSSGYLDTKIEIESHDEMRELASYFDKTTAELSRLMKGIMSAAKEVGEAKESIVSSTKEADEALQKANDAVEVAKGSVEAVVSAIEQTNVGIEGIANASQETAKNAQQADEQMSKMNELQQEGKESVQEAVERIKNIKDMTDKTVEAVNKLQSSSQEIGAIVDMINSIAEQTNLLALNAAIEAARAGEAGKGFAVVAEEIRNLAEETKKATMNIGKLIEGIQEDTNDAVKVMNDTTKAVEEGTEAMDEVTKGLEEILEAVSKTSGMIQNIASMAEEQSASTEEMANTVNAVSKSSNEIAVKMDDIKDATDRQTDIMKGLVMKTEELLAKSLKDLNEYLKEFKI